ncbi:MAG: hypothetical protein FK733_15390 [Asgard group archaeon]|nr:hypothetical protein [Asgard group archaeon]
MSIVVNDSLAYVLDLYQGLLILDIQDISSPVHLYNFDDGGEANCVFYHNELIYIADGYDGLEIVGRKETDLTTFIKPIYIVSVSFISGLIFAVQIVSKFKKKSRY